MAAYAEYQYYTEEFGGTAILEDDFPALAVRASREIDLITMGKIAGTEWADNAAVKNAVCAVAEVIHADDARQSAVGFKTSETVGRVSVSYQEAVPLDAQIYSAVKAYLFTTGLLYRGCGCAHKHGCDAL